MERPRRPRPETKARRSSTAPQPGTFENRPGCPIATAAYPHWLDNRLYANVQTAAGPTWSDVVPPTRFPVRRCLLGCVLVRRDALAAMQPPWFMSTVTATRYVGDDEWFCAKAAEARQAIVCDGAVMCASLRQGTNLLVLAGRDITGPGRA